MGQASDGGRGSAHLEAELLNQAVGVVGVEGRRVADGGVVVAVELQHQHAVEARPGGEHQSGTCGRHTDHHILRYKTHTVSIHCEFYLVKTPMLVQSCELP